MEGSLLLCPFCGSTSKNILEDGYWSVICDACDAKGGIGYTESEAIALWNRRSQKGDTAIPQQLKAEIAACIPSLVESYNHMRDSQFNACIEKLRQLSAV